MPRLQVLRPADRRGPAGGFTLTELMIAIGILGVGLAMAAALFPAALRNASTSSRNVVGSIVAENGLVLARTRMSNEIGAGTLGSAVQDISNKLGEADRKYPVADNNARWQIVLLGRRVTKDQNDTSVNDYHLISVSCFKQDSANRAAAVQVQGTLLTESGRSTLKLANAGDLNTTVKIGSPVIMAANGNYARVVALVPPEAPEPAKAILDGMIYTDLTGGPYPFWVIAEYSAGGSLVSGGDSPAAAILVSRMSLKTKLQ